MYITRILTLFITLVTKSHDPLSISPGVPLFLKVGAGSALACRLVKIGSRDLGSFHLLFTGALLGKLFSSRMCNHDTTPFQTPSHFPGKASILISKCQFGPRL